MSNNRITFSRSIIQSLPLPNRGKRSYYYDSKVEGLGLSVTDVGGKTFIVYRWVKGKPTRITLGKFHTDALQDEDFERNPLSVLGMKYLKLDVDQARKLARAVVAELSAGRNPLEKKQQRSGCLTFEKLFNEYIDKHAKLNTKSWQETVHNFRRYFAQWAGREVSSITQSEVQDWVDNLANTSGKHTANRNYDTMRAVISWGIRKKRIVNMDNPCIGVDRFKTKSRERFVLPGDEFTRLAHAINREDDLMRDFFWMCFFTGARKSNVLAMRWDQIHLELHLWIIPETKNGESQAVPLTHDAIALLQMRKEKTTGPWVFPSHGKTGHLASPKGAWKRIIKSAAIENLRIHDLRRTVGSLMAIRGINTPTIGKALGHKSQQATLVYARLTQGPVRQALEDMNAALKNTNRPFHERQDNLSILQY